MGYGMNKNKLYLDVLESKLENINRSKLRIDRMILFGIGSVYLTLLSLVAPILIPYILALMVGIFITIIGLILILNSQMEDYIKYVSMIQYEGKDNNSIFKK